MDFSNIRAFAFDVDGVFTDGGVLCNLDGELFRTFDAKDGFAVRMATMKGYPVGIITGGRSASIRSRFRTCGVPQEDVFLGSRNKMEDIDAFCRRHGMEMGNVLYVGDDIPDVQAIAECGLGACPADAVQEVKDVSDLVSSKVGGHGCVREIIETVMKAHGTWVFDVDRYKKLF